MSKQPYPEPGINSGRSLAQILIVLVVLLVLVNIPLNDLGIGLAHLMPDRPPVVIQEGMLLKGSEPAVYLLENHRLRRISSPEAYRAFFQHRRGVTQVEDEILVQFEEGPPIRRWLSCRATPLIYALENGQKRLCPNGCQDDETRRTGQTRPWDAIRPISCDRLHSLPDGPPLTAQTTRPLYP